MRGKRSKQYRKLMERYCMTFGFREPYQVLVDAEMVQDSCRFKMELEPALQRTAHGKVKPMITQCEIRKLYARKDEPGISEAIEVAKSCERRRCGHHPEDYPEPLSTLECFQSVVDPKDTGENKHRYVVASQSQELRRMLRGVRGVPLIYIKRSVMILEPMSDESVRLRAREERSKFRAGLKPTIGKRKRDDKDDEDEDEDGVGKSDGEDTNLETSRNTEEKQPAKKKSKRPGPKGPNPLSVKKKSKKPTLGTKKPKKVAQKDESAEPAAKRKRKRKAKPSTAASGGDGAERSAPQAVSNGDEA
ncbi:rRNA-processing protein UTP23 [Pochonia chlamydosporia 170]|uniref:U three protein 23 n=1 Tax=Pochonia chlamydosporia 170 TaxID=1380566 RepID=A0A179G490_METCM|nr:rRNA-processing protein UTP23 [Pochonia chlamydosporia 170]OAQ72330.1 rRNA-processing protein UTP23 [Pochonia chlamydosporia 170]